jgi:hypothetical protein
LEVSLEVSKTGRETTEEKDNERPRTPRATSGDNNNNNNNSSSSSSKTTRLNER